eukprot:2825311-Pleurochrysis_carterae.AAC.1
MRCLAHVSPGVARGGAFTPFTCPCCEYSPSESEALADRREYDSLSEKGAGPAHCRPQRDWADRAPLRTAPPPDPLHSTLGAPRHGSGGR